MTKALMGMQGLSGRAVVTSRGITREAELTIPPGADPQTRQLMEGFRQSLRQIGSPFPQEPVGAGARWETIVHLSQNGLVLTQTSISRLVALQGDAGKLAIELRQAAEPQEVKAPNLPPGAKLELLSYSGSGEGETEFDLGRLAPSRGRVQLTADSRMMLQLEGPKQEMAMQKQEMAMKMRMAVEMEGK